MPSESRTWSGNGWIIQAVSGSISNAAELDELHAELKLSLPEMTFGGNSLSLFHAPSGWRYSFDTKAALAAVHVGPPNEQDALVKVEYADKWLSSRTAPDSKLPLPQTLTASPYDWTYSSTYAGTSIDTDIVFLQADPENTAHAIPLHELARKDPIHFFAEVPLYEDELHDNGISQFTVRIRVMPTCFFILSRLVVQVNGVLFRSFETRLYHSFNSLTPLIVRETRGLEAPFHSIKELLPNQEDMSPLTNANFIAQSLASLPSSLAGRSRGKPGWKGIGRKMEVAALTARNSSL